MLKELGEYKDRLSSIFVNDDKICRLLLGENYENEVEDPDLELDKYVTPHLFIENTIDQAKSYIMFETYVPKTSGNTKTVQIVVQAICHKDIIKYPEKPGGYTGFRYDVLAQYIEELLCPTGREELTKIIRKFGIGRIELNSVDLFLTEKFVGRTLTFTFPAFR